MPAFLYTCKPVFSWVWKLHFAVLRLSKLGWDGPVFSFLWCLRIQCFLLGWEAELCRSAAQVSQVEDSSVLFFFLWCGAIQCLLWGMSSVFPFTVRLLRKAGWEEFSLSLFDVKPCSAPYWNEKLRFAVLTFSKASWNEYGLSFCDLNHFITAC